MKLIRTFHSVGQGAFYTEKHTIDDNIFTIVYDCGSTTLGKKNLELKIKSTFQKDSVIDILFISHFHTDHINGIDVLKQHCKIKKVVMPCLDEKAKALLKINNFLNENNSETQLIDDPDSYFGDSTTIIRVQEIDLEQEIETEQNSDTKGRIDVSLTNSSQVISSGTILQSGIHEWFFIPFNYKQNERTRQFVVALRNVNLSIDDIDTIEKIAIHKKKIRTAYNKIDGDLNQNSLVLFSGIDETRLIEYNKCYDFRFLSRFRVVDIGCIYFGDIDLTQPNIIENIKTELNHFFQFVGTIQVPHHGSIHNFNGSILEDSNINFTVLSFGINNTYGHPSYSVIGEILSRDALVHLATENPNTTIIQWN